MVEITDLIVGQKVKIRHDLQQGKTYRGIYCNVDIIKQCGKTVTVSQVRLNSRSFSTEQTHNTHFSVDMVEKIIDYTPSDVEQKEPEKKKSPSLTLNLGVDMNAVVTSAITEYITNNEAIVSDQIKLQVVDQVTKQIATLKPTIIKIPERKDVTIEGKVHNKFEEVVFLANSEKQVYLFGPAGSGKTTLCSQVAKALELPFAHISCSAGMSEAHLLGRMLFDGTYVKSDFVDLYENGGVFLFDEIDAADPNTLLVINSALANGTMSVPNRKDNPKAKRHENFICIVAGNTLGNGSVEYSGRNFLDAAFLDRFTMSKVQIDYDTDLEKEICTGHNDVLLLLSAIRNRVLSHKVQKIVSTRAFVSAVRLAKQGTPLKDIKNILTLGWSDEEKKKCL